MGKKVYAVRKGAVPGIYATWAECEAQVRGVSGAEYKGFKSEDEARAWLREEEAPVPPSVPAPSASAAPLQGPVAAAGATDDLPPWDLPEETEASPVPTPQPRPPSPESQTPAAPQTDYRQQLEAKATAFLTHLQEQGVPAYAASGGSEYHERIGIDGNGYLDLYHTKRHPFDLRSSAVGDPVLCERVLSLWRAFHWGADADAEVEAPSSPWDVVEHYYSLLKPYAELRFDFIALARALRNASAEAPDPDDVRYDFPQIESFYKRFRAET